MKKLLQYSVSLFVVVIVLLMIIPLNTFLLDVMIILNISISLIILLITMNIRNPLEFSIFPSLLLVTTLFRLGLNVASTRNILTNQGSAGQVIHAFGTFVLQGNIVVGFVIFLIIVLVQFIVITKGAERVAEVAARFTLDAMPGKQMAIDADLSSGIITEQQARERRDNVQREADFYGAMDGATKIVKGDAIMSIIITAVNLIAGMVVGMVQAGMPLDEALSVYSIATVGDGLVSQIPALMISTATGMVVTRSVAQGSLNEDVSRQFMAQPRAIMMAGIVVLFLVVVPGMPKIQLIIVGGLLVFAGSQLSARMKEAAEKESQQAVQAQKQEQERQADEEEYYRDIDNVYSLISVDPIEMEFGYSLIPLVDESEGGKMLKRLAIFRRQYAQEMGFVIPSVTFRDSSSLSTNQYAIKIKGEEVARGEILVDYYLALEPQKPTGQLDGIDAVEPAYGIPSKWIRPENRELAEIYGYTVIDPLSVMITHLTQMISQHTWELLTRQEVVKLVENVKKTSPELVSETIPAQVSYGTFQKILVELLREDVPIKDLETILESVSDSIVRTKDLIQIGENVREALKRTITRKFCDGGQIRVITLDPELQKTMSESLTKGDQGYYMALSPEKVQTLLVRVGEAVKKFSELKQKPVILTNQVLRIYVYRLLQPFYPSICVLAFNELGDNVQIQTIGNITV